MNRLFKDCIGTFEDRYKSSQTDLLHSPTCACYACGKIRKVYKFVYLSSNVPIQYKKMTYNINLPTIQNTSETQVQWLFAAGFW